MKNKKIIMMLGIMLIIFAITNVLGEMNLWTTTLKDINNSIVDYHSFYYFDDTSARGIGKNKDIPVTFWFIVEALPYNFNGLVDSFNNSGYGEVDYCNFTVTHFHNIYGTTFIAFIGNTIGDLLNTTIETQSYYFANSSLNSSRITINMRDKDYITADMRCHYTDLRSLYFDNALIGRYSSYMPSFECNSCTQYSLEELSNQRVKNENITQNELIVYDNIQTVIGWNFQLWLIASWIIKIGLVFVAVGLIFAGGYYFYIFLKNLAEGMES